MNETGKPMTARPLADALETLRDDLATGEMPVEEVEHRITLLAEQARGAEPVALASSELRALPERLRAAVESIEELEGGAPDGLLGVPTEELARAIVRVTKREAIEAIRAAWPAVEADVRAAVEGEIAERIEAMATEDLSPDPEAPATGELPARWEELRAVMNKALNELPDYRSGRVYGLVPKELVLGAVSAALKPLWPAPLPPAAWEAIEAALRCVAVCEGCGATEIDVLEPDGDGGHARSEPGPGSEPVPVHCGPVTIRFDAALQALRSVELASAARAQRLHDGIEAAILRLQGRDGDGAYDALDAALDAAPPSDPWAALMALLAEWEQEVEQLFAAKKFDLAGHEQNMLAQLRRVLGLPPKETP